MQAGLAAVRWSLRTVAVTDGMQELRTEEDSVNRGR